MEEEPPRKKLRKGTRSCIECRRRKIRCTWQNEHDSTCDGCLARGLSCRSQEFALEHEHSDNESTTAPSRDRVSRLERTLEELVDRVRFLERGNGQDNYAKHSGRQISEIQDVVPTMTTSALVEAEAADLPGGNPTHIRSLFEGAFVEAGASLSRKASPSPPPPRGLLAEREALRRELLRLVPSNRDVELVLQYALDWWVLVDTGVPSVSIDSKKELRAVAERVRRPDSDPALIALWLVTAAITVQQVPPDVNRTVFEDPSMLREFPETVMMRVESVLAAHQEVAATVSGIECSLMLVKLQLNCGRVRKAWLTLRAGIACAELSGLSDIVRSPDTLSRLAHPNSTLDTTDHSSPALKAAIWIQLSFLERILGIILNLPSTTRGRPPQLPRYLLRHNGPGREFFWSLSNIAIKIRDRDDSIAYSETGTDWIAETEALERELQDLADTAGMCEREPGIGGAMKFSEHSGALPVPLLQQHMYFYLLLRTHLPLMMQGTHNTTAPQLSSAGSPGSTATGANLDAEAIARAHRSHALCVYACTRMGRLYLQQFSGPSRGLFPIRLADFMAFTAIAILLLEQEGVLQPAIPAGLAPQNAYRDTSGDAKLLDELVSALKQAARQEGRVIAAQAVKAVESIRATLATHDDPHSAGTSIKVPLLGTMRVRRRSRSVAADTPDSRHGKRTSRGSYGNSSIEQPADKKQYQAPPMTFYPGAMPSNTGTLTPNSMNSFAGVTNRYNPNITSLQQRLNPGTAAWLSNSLPNQARMSSLPSLPSPMSMDLTGKLPGLPGTGSDQYDWVAETMNMYDTGATSTQDALWLWDDNTFGAF